MPDKRRSQRISQEVTIQLIGMQPGASSAVAQPAKTIDVSPLGALVECRSKFAPGAEVMIHNPRNLLNGVFKVVHCNLSSGGASWNVAVEMQPPDESDFWGLSSAQTAGN